MRFVIYKQKQGQAKNIDMQEITALLTISGIFLTNALWIMGFHRVFQPGMLLVAVAEWMKVTPLCRPEVIRLRFLLKRNSELTQLLESGTLNTCLDEHIPIGKEFEENTKEITKIHKEGDRYSRVSPFIQDPLYACPYCMASIHGTIGFSFSGLSWWFLPVWCICLCGLVVLAWRGE